MAQPSPTIQFTIVGLSLIGASIGLALASQKDQVKRVGNDKDLLINRKAEKMGAVDKIIDNLPKAVANADAVIIAEPVDEVRRVLELISADLKPGAVVIDTSPAAAASSEWAQELLPGPDRYFVSMLPCLNPAYLMDDRKDNSAARADLFRNGLMLVSCPPGTHASALELASNLAAALGAQVLMSDAIEKDGLIAAAMLLPQLSAAALLNTTTAQAGWREARKVASTSFALASAPANLLPEDKELGKTALLNADNTVRMLNLLINELDHLRGLIQSKDADALSAYLQKAVDARALWLNQRQAAEWELASQKVAPASEGFFSRIFGFRGKKSQDKK